MQNNILHEILDDELYEHDLNTKTLVLEIHVEAGQEPLRIDKYLMTKKSGATRSKIQKAIEDGDVIVNNEPIKQNYKIKPGDYIQVYSRYEPSSTEIIPENIPIEIVYEDDYLLVVNKPYNMVVHPGHGNKSGTLVNGLAYHLGLQSTKLNRVGLVHRIDKDTTGLLVIGKTENAIESLMKQFKEHTVKRTYRAIVWGDVLKDEDTIDTYIARDERNRLQFTVYPQNELKGKHAITHYKVLERLYYVTYLECNLETGRTHQIRVHLKHIGHTIFNDCVYGGNKILKGTVYSKYKSFVENCFQLCPRHALHAKTLGFKHPRTGEEMFFNSDLPKDMDDILVKWRLYVQTKM